MNSVFIPFFESFNFLKRPQAKACGLFILANQHPPAQMTSAFSFFAVNQLLLKIPFYKEERFVLSFEKAKRTAATIPAVSVLSLVFPSDTGMKF
mgnify:CR=1 FL=1